MKRPAPVVRLALAVDINMKRQQKALAPVVRLAHAPGAQGDNVLVGKRGVSQLPAELAPGLLVSFVYLEAFLKARERYAFRDWALDSGAFSAFNKGAAIDLERYTETARRLLAEDELLAEVFALDVIGDWRASLKNTEKMWAAGVEAIPCYHLGEPEDVLLGMARDYPKIALGGFARLHGLQRKLRWAEQCFARVWPKKIHGFSAGSAEFMAALPWHSVDATSWEIRPCAFGSWASFGRMSVRGGGQNLRAEVEFYLGVERRARSRWAKEMQLLDELAQKRGVDG